MSLIKGRGWFFLLFFFLAPFLFADESPLPDHAQIRYKLLGRNKGTEELYIKKDKIRSITRIKTARTQSAIAIDLLSIVDGIDIVVVDLNQKYGTRLPNRYKKTYSEMSEEEQKAFKWEILLGLPQETHYENIGKEMILGKECTVIRVRNKALKMKVWVWNDLILKWQLTTPFKLKKVATSVDSESPLNDEIFQIPKEITVEKKI